mgnify:CR=1 FL=1
MSDEQEQERDAEAATIGPRVNAAQLELDIDAISRRTRKFLVEQQNTIDRLTAERDAARAEVERLRAACSRKEDVYPTETVITRSASDLLVEFSQFAFFLGDIRKSKEASYRAQYIRAALNDGTEADHD